MDIGVTISKVRKEYREYLRETHPDWADTTISTHVSDAFYLYQNTIALSFWKCFESDASMEKAKGEIFDYLKQEVMSDRADERTAQYYRDLKRLKEFIDSKGGVKTYIGYEYDCEVIVYKYAKMVYDGTMEMDAAVKAMCQEVPCFGETSHKLTIMLFASMMKGIKYTRRSNTETTVYFIVHIGKDYGQEQMVNALKATQENIKYYYEQTGNKSNSIGMMNTADRSLAMLDYALRRRFAFFELTPAFSSAGFRAYRTKVNNPKFDRLIATVEQLNDVIANDDSLGEGFCIGHSYFCTNATINDEWMRSVVEYELIPLLKEYWFDEAVKVKDWSRTLREVVK